jgi:type III pantothenate kinase
VSLSYFEEITMILCLDVGNTQVYGGIFAHGKILLRFRYDSKSSYSSDQHGIFLKSILRENNIDSAGLQHISICSVVPNIDYSLRAACIKYFGITPFFLQAGATTGLKIKYYNPQEVGADRIANSIAAVAEFPNQNLIVVDFGTATTMCVISAQKEYLGGVILAGIQLSMNALQANTAKLFSVEIIQPHNVIGRSTAESIQSGLYYSQLSTIKEVTSHICANQFANQKPIIIGTGGFAHLFEKQNLFSVILPDLVLHGLHIAITTNVLNKQAESQNA